MREQTKPQRSQSNAVKWLLGADLMRELLSITKSVIANELDMRDWMANTFVENLRRDKDGNVVTDVWFDYIADTGDDTRVMEALATHFGRDYDADELKRAPQKDPKGTPILDWSTRSHPRLERGAFLFVGGDTAYHVADEMTLRERFVEPCNRTPRFGTRSIFGIPGNHDYYDNLAGFNRLFRRPYPPTKPVLFLEDYAPKQEASYVKILLPGAWELWGADLGPHGLDHRQHKYFRPGDEVPSHLILCTAVPPVCFNREMVKKSTKKKVDKEREGYEKLLGPEHSLNSVEFAAAKGVEMPAGTCRLHLGGDKHHYARYSGHTNALDDSPSELATVVSGGGGAFLHPTETECGSLVAATKYPPPAESRRQTARSLIWPFTIMGAGLLVYIGALLMGLIIGSWPDNGFEVKGGVEWGACVLGALGVAYGCVQFSQFRAKRRKERARASRDTGTSAPTWIERRLRGKSIFIAPLGVIVAAAIPFIVHHVTDKSLRPLEMSALWIASMTVFGLGMVLLGALVGGANHAGYRWKILFGVLGGLHGVIQVGLVHQVASHHIVMVPFTFIACWAVFACSYLLYRCESVVLRRLVTILWLLQGIGLIVALKSVQGLDVHRDYRWVHAVLAGAVLVPMQFGFYLLVASAWNGHNNEAGICGRVTNYKQWIRFHVTQNKLTGYVLAIDKPSPDDDSIDARPYVVDKFVIAPAATNENGGS